MPHSRYRNLAAALLLTSLILLGPVGAAGPAAAGGQSVVYLPAVTNVVFFTLQPGSPTYLANFLNQFGCNWSGIAGRVFGLDGNPIVNLTVHLEGGGLNADAVTGAGPLALGPGGYLIPLSDHPFATSGVYFIQLRNTGGAPLSGTFMIPTFDDCARNMILVNFAPAD